MTYPVPENWNPPSDSAVGAANFILKPWSRITSPSFFGVERVPTDRPVMFIGNHTLMGMLDTPLLLLGTYEHTGHFCRSMGDHFHFQVPLWRDLLLAFGCVDGTRENCRAVMGDGHSLMIFPGGGREVFKQRGEAYKLLWGKRRGFARLALDFGYTIVPVASVGAEECYKIILDQDALMKTYIGSKIAQKSPRKDVMLPTIVRGLYWSLLPIPQRFYFGFGHPIESVPYKECEDRDEAIWELREEVRKALTAEIEATLQGRNKAQN